MRVLKDLSVDATSAAGENQLANRFVTSDKTVESTPSVRRRVVGITGRCSDTGYLKIIRGSAVVVTIDMALLNALTFELPLDIDIIVGEPLSVYAVLDAGSAACAVALSIEEGT